MTETEDLEREVVLKKPCVQIDGLKFLEYYPEMRAALVELVTMCASVGDFEIPIRDENDNHYLLKVVCDE